MTTQQDPTTYGNVSWVQSWEEYTKGDRNPAPDYLFESGDPEVPLGEFAVDATEYTSRKFHDREVSCLWPKVWQMACRANDIPQVGDYLEYEVAGYSILVVRDAPTTIKAFRNACRHRATAVATGRGSAECFVCPFHGWTYGLDGSLQAVPAKWDFPHVDQETTGLHPVLAEVFDGWVFINMDPSAPPLAEFLGDTITRHLLTHPSEGKHKTLHVGLVVESNWKATAEAFMEAYHVPQTHPQGRAFIGDLQTRYDIFGRHARTITPKGVPSAFYGPLDEQVIFAAFGGALAAEDLPEVPEGTTARQHVCDLTRAAGASQGLDAERISDAELLDTIAYNIFPNFLVVLRPGASSAMRFRPNGDDHTTSIFEYMVFNVMPPDQDLPGDVPLHMLGPDESLVDYQEQIPAAYFYDQDVGTLVLAKKGLRNADQLLFGHRQERNIVAFHRHLAQFIADREQ